MHQPRAKRVPISVVTGFLGSGKTTLVNQLVQHPGLARTLIIVNELGEIGLDHDLVEEATDDVVLLQSGCLCCSVRSDLIETLTSVNSLLSGKFLCMRLYEHRAEPFR